MSTRVDLEAPGSGHHDPAAAVVLPSPPATFLAGTAGAAAGFGSVLGLTHLQVPHMVGMVVLAVLLTLALAGPQLLTTARREWTRALAVAMGALAFGGATGGLVVSFVL